MRDGLGPYLAIYLLTVQHWAADRIGMVMTIMGIATLVAQGPAGALVDATRKKRALIVVAAIIVPLACLAITLAPGFGPVAAARR